MPTLLQINITANWGSTGKIAEQIGKAAIDQGWKSYIAYGRNCEPSSSALIKIGGKINTYTHYIQQRIFDNEGLCSDYVTKKLVNTIKTISPDIIHLHNIHDHYLNYRILFEYLNSTDIKVVWTFHDFWAVTGHCMHFINVCCSRFTEGCHNCPMKKIYPKTIIDRSIRNFNLKKYLFTSNRNLTIVSVSEWVNSMVAKSFLKDKAKKVINNGIDLQSFKPTKSDVITDRFKGKFVILSVASQWKFDKGLDDYIKISKMLSHDEVIVLVGIEKTLSESLPQNIIGINHTTDIKELAAIYTRADVLTILSSAETFGLTVVEAYACGTPAIVYDNTAPPSLITSKTGFVVENHNYIKAYEAIKRIKSLGKNTFSEACMLEAKSKYNKHESTLKYLTLYKSLLLNQS